MKALTIGLVVIFLILIGAVSYIVINQINTQKELSEFKSTYKEEIKKEIEESCKRLGSYGLGKSESWIDDDLIGSENLDTCKEICNRLDGTCQSGSIEELIEEDRWSGGTIIACNTPFGIDKTSQGSVSCICCS